MPRIVKDCFGTVISTLTKMKECVRCELLAECRSINWTAPPEDDAPVVIVRRDPRPDPPADGAAPGGGADTARGGRTGTDGGAEDRIPGAGTGG